MYSISVCKQLTNIEAIKSVFFANVRFYLEWVWFSVLARPSTRYYIRRIESIQKKFLMYALRRSVKMVQNHLLTTLSKSVSGLMLNIFGAEGRRKNLTVLFVFDFLRCIMNAPKLAARENILMSILLWLKNTNKCWNLIS